MSRATRAKQFAPFDALKGLREALKMKEYEHDRMQKSDLSEEKILEISKTIQKIKKNDDVYVKYFFDGYYLELSGKAKVDIPFQKIEICGKKIAFEDVFDLKILNSWFVWCVFIYKIMKTYNRQLAVGYAKQWALSHNPNFYHFGGIGGDCTNFVSQCLLAGGAVMNYDKTNGWFYVNINNRSASWTGVEFFERFLTKNRHIGPFGEIWPVENLEIGDIIQLRQNLYRFNHTLIITKIENAEIFVCAHSHDVKDFPLSSYPYIERRGIHILGVREIWKILKSFWKNLLLY